MVYEELKMNKFEKVLPFIYAIIFALPAALGLGAVSAVLLSGLLCAEYVKKTPVNYALLLVFIPCFLGYLLCLGCLLLSKHYEKK